MSAYSEYDLIAAFDCAEDVTSGGSSNVADVRGLVTKHLLSECDCQRNRCPKCGCRPRNSIPRHKSDCPNAQKKA